MSRRICMFLWNHFTNDARVLREAETLSKEGYQVDVIAIHDHKNSALQKEEYLNKNLRVKRVERVCRVHLWFLFLQQNIKIRLKDKKNLVYLLPVVPILALLYVCCKTFGLMMRKTGILGLYNKVCILTGMVREGLSKPYDIYHSHDLNTLLQGYICKLIRKKILVYDSHEVQTSRTGYKGKKYYYFEKFLIKRIDKMIMTDDMRADYTVRKYGIPRPDIIHNYPVYKLPDKNAVDLHSLFNIPIKEPILLYQGGIQTGRGLEKIVEALPMINKGVVVFIGDGKLKNKIKDMCRQNGIDDRVRFVGKVPVRQLLNYTCGAYLGFQVLQNMCFNHYSTTSNKLFEYIMCEVPVIASDFPEIKKVVDGEGVGLCIDPHEPRNIATAVNYMIENNREYEAFKNNCKRAREKYNWEVEKSRLINLYQDISVCLESEYIKSGVISQ